jgi:hypothetical protein
MVPLLAPPRSYATQGIQSDSACFTATSTLRRSPASPALQQAGLSPASPCFTATSTQPGQPCCTATWTQCSAAHLTACSSRLVKGLSQPLLYVVSLAAAVASYESARQVRGRKCKQPSPTVACLHGLPSSWQPWLFAHAAWAPSQKGRTQPCSRTYARSDEAVLGGTE